MAQHNNEHLTIAQLSAYVDKELAANELALCDAHMRTCQVCQAALADLRLTSALLRGMPRVEVPRSFVLPTNLTVLPVTPARAEPRSLQSSGSLYILKRSLRALSALAAVIGLVFILAGAITALPRGGAAYNASTTAAPAASGISSQVGPASTSPISGPEATQRSATATNRKTSTPAGPSATSTPTNRSPEQQPESQPVVDLGKPSGRLEVGSACLLLGILGLFVSRRFWHDLDSQSPRGAQGDS